MVNFDDAVHHINLAMYHVLVPTVVAADRYHDGLVPYERPQAGWGASHEAWRTQVRAIRGELILAFPWLVERPTAFQTVRTLTQPLSLLRGLLADEILDKPAQAAYALTLALQQRHLLPSGFRPELVPRAVGDLTATHWELVVASALQQLDAQVDTAAVIARDGFENPLSSTVSRMAPLIK